MEKPQAFNPYLPGYEYIADGEPHVFGDRVYIYGSHDRFNGTKFCQNDYVCYSADVEQLANWRYEGVIYRKTQDPRMTDGNHELWAPDVVKGKDGKYYLFYCPDDTIKSIGVAVCDFPAGQYRFWGLVKDISGNIIGEREGDTYSFDPSVLVDDDGSIYLYSGNGPSLRENIGKEPKASVVMKLADDMLTVLEEPRKLLPILGDADGTGFESHEFFEASSIRKMKGRYYLVYSSVKAHELCYAVSNYPDRGFQYGGVIVSNCDLFPDRKNQLPVNCIGNNHGGIEEINGRYYIFYHRQTNRSMFSRQGCAEEIFFEEDGSIPQVEITSCGLNQGPLQGNGTYSAAIACQLYGAIPPTYSIPSVMGDVHPYLTQEGDDYNPTKQGNCNPPVQYIANCEHGMVAGYKYFLLDEKKQVRVTVRGTANGKIIIRRNAKGCPIGEISISPCETWCSYFGKIFAAPGITALFFCYEGEGRMDFLEFSLTDCKGNDERQGAIRESQSGMGCCPFC